MAKQGNTLVTPVFRGSFVHVVTPRAFEAGDDPKYSCLIVVPKKEKAFLKKMQAAMKATAQAKFGTDVKMSALKIYVKDGDGAEVPESLSENVEGCVYFNASSNFRPGVIDTDGNPLTSEDEVYSGAHYRATISFYAWQHPKGGRGVSINLRSLLKVRDDEAFTTRSDPMADFSDFLEGDADPDPDVETADDDNESETKKSAKKKRSAKKAKQKEEDDDDDDDDDFLDY